MHDFFVLRWLSSPLTIDAIVLNLVQLSFPAENWFVFAFCMTFLAMFVCRPFSHPLNFHCLLRWDSLRGDWPALRHSKGEDADVPWHVQRNCWLFCENLQTSGISRLLQGDHTCSGSQRCGELCSFHVLWVLPTNCAENCWSRQENKAQVSNSSLFCI